MKLDSQDQRILRMLGQDGRASNVRIATAIGVSQSAVKKRIDRLVEDGVCKVLGVVNPKKLGHVTDIFVGMKVEHDRRAEVYDALQCLPEVCFVGQLTGRYDILTELLLHGSADVFAVLTEKIVCLPGVVSMETFVAWRQTWWRAVEWWPSNGAESSAEQIGRWDGFSSHASRGSQHRDGDPHESPVPELDDVDYHIMSLLRENGRRPTADIAREVGLGRAGVGQRIQRLIDSGTCKVTAVIDPAALGFTVNAHIYLETDPKREAEIGEVLARLPQVRWLGHVTGPSPVFVDILARSADEVFEIVARSIAPLPGVRAVDTSLVVQYTVWLPSEWRPTNGFDTGTARAVATDVRGADDGTRERSQER